MMLLNQGTVDYDKDSLTPPLTSLDLLQNIFKKWNYINVSACPFYIKLSTTQKSNIVKALNSNLNYMISTLLDFLGLNIPVCKIEMIMAFTLLTFPED